MTKDRLKCIILSHKRIAIVTILFVLIILYIMFSLLMNGTKKLKYRT